MKTLVSFDRKTGRPKAAKMDLGSEEAQWLHNLVQNPVGCTPESESPQDAAIRKKFFTALQDFGPGALI